MPIPTLLKQALAPGSIGFLILCAIAYGLLRYARPRAHRSRRALTIVVVGAYFVMSLPVVAMAVADRLGPLPVDSTTSLSSIDALIVLDGDNRVGRAQEAHRVWQMAQPHVVYVLGAGWIRDALAERGVPSSQIVQDPGPVNTREQMGWVGRFVMRSPAPHVALIASRLQMPRVAALARAANLSVTLVASPIDQEPPRTGVRLFVPTYVGLRVTRDALYEHAALAFYSWRGWIARDALRR